MWKLVSKSQKETYCELLSKFLSLQPNCTRIEMSYPIHIRFLDMKKGRNGKGKKRYAPIYNKYVYGYLKSDVARKLNRLVPDIMINAIKDTIE